MPEFDERADDHETLIQHALAFMIEALQLLDSAGAHQSASLLDHAICVLPREDLPSMPIRKQSNESH